MGSSVSVGNCMKRQGPPPLSCPPPDTVFSTADEVAEMLRTTRAAVYARVARGQLAGVTKLGRSLLFDRRVLLEFLRDQQRAPSPRSR
jgi:hypothetical protein